MDSIENNHFNLQLSNISSSSSSSSNPSYELLPLPQPQLHLARDLPSPRTTFTFKKVQPGSDSFNRSHNDSRNSLPSDSRREEIDSRDYILTNNDLSDSKHLNTSRQGQSRRNTQNNYQNELNIKITKLQEKIKQLQTALATSTGKLKMDIDIKERYDEAFQTLRRALESNYNFKGKNLEQTVEKIVQIVGSRELGQHGVIQAQDVKIRQLRAQLLKSSQNNINAIFNTEITQAHCLHLQIKKMNGEILTLKENLMEVKRPQGSYPMVYPHSDKQQKIVNIYHHRGDSSSDEDVSRSRTKKHSKKHRKRQDSSSSSEHKHAKSRLLVQTEGKMGQLLEGYKTLREEYRRLEGTIRELNSNQTEYRNLFQSLRTDISSSINNQMVEVKRTIQRPSSSQSQKQIARDLQSKLEHLINTLNRPEKVNLEESQSEESSNHYHNVDLERRIIDLQTHNSKLQLEIHRLQRQNQQLQEKLIQAAQNHHHNQQHNQRELIIHKQITRREPLQPAINHQHFQPIAKERELLIPKEREVLISKEREVLIPKEREVLISKEREVLISKEKQFIDKGHIGNEIELDEFLSSRSDLKQQQIVENFEQMETNNINVVHSSGLNKVHSSQSYHQSSRNSQLQTLSRKIDHYRELVRQKDRRIAELQNTIVDHLNSQPLVECQDSIKQRYQLYITNLRLLLGEAKKQSEMLKQQLLKTSELSLSRGVGQQQHNSIAFSDRTTKNQISQTRMIRRRAPAEIQASNNYEIIQLKLQIQDQLENIFMAMLQLYAKVTKLQQQNTELGSIVHACIRWLIKEARLIGSRLSQETLHKEHVKKLLAEVAIPLN